MITNLEDLHALAVNGLHVDEGTLDRYVRNSPSSPTTAAYNMLKDWANKQRNKKAACTKLCSTLRKVWMANIISAMEEDG